MPGHSVCDGGLVVDLRALDRVDVDPRTRRAQVQGGALLGTVDAATQVHGLAVPAGVVSHTGIAGLTLGGGMGWLTRLGGLTIDRLVRAEVVLADGRVVHASADEHPDLFWALRGGGGNFGIVTEFEFDLVEVGPIIDFAMLFWPQEQARDALKVLRDRMHELPRSLNGIIAALDAPPAPFVPADQHGRRGCALLLAGFGDHDAHQHVVDTICAELPPAFTQMGPMPYVALQQLIDDANPWGFHYYDKSGYIAELTDPIIDIIATQGADRHSPLSVILLYRLDAAYCDVADNATAFGGGRTDRYTAFIIADCPDPTQLPAERTWARNLHETLRPHLLETGTYVNAVGADEPDRVRAAYGHKYDRLLHIKTTYDPDNLFHHNANIH